MDSPVLMANLFYLHWVYNEIKSLVFVPRSLTKQGNVGGGECLKKMPCIGLFIGPFLHSYADPALLF